MPNSEKTGTQFVGGDDPKAQPLVVGPIPWHLGVRGQRQGSHAVLLCPGRRNLHQRPADPAVGVVGVHRYLVDVGITVHDLEQQVRDRLVTVVRAHPSPPVVGKRSELGNGRWCVIGHFPHPELPERGTGGLLHILQTLQVVVANWSNHSCCVADQPTEPQPSGLPLPAATGKLVAHMAFRVVATPPVPEIVERLLRGLPEWFGIESSIAEYAEAAAAASRICGRDLLTNSKSCRHTVITDAETLDVAAHQNCVGNSYRINTSTHRARRCCPEHAARVCQGPTVDQNPDHQTDALMRIAVMT